MNRLDTLVTRLLLACVFGLTVAGITIYLIPGGGDYLAYPQQQTRRHIEWNSKTLDEYRSKKGAFPSPGTPEAEEVLFPRDAWGRPFLYSLPDGRPLIESLGRDGVRGGVGLDADISNRIPHPPEEAIPLLQKLTHPLARGMILAALVCGILSAYLVFAALKDETLRSKSWGVLGSALFVSCAMATYGAMVIAMFHVPSGH